jgi:2-keto-4-pentenoate hydratase/2-oxohepta-3-ene-1,7-dioic acid hydratase in catechol pathway
MKIARFRQKRRVAYGVVEGEEVAEIRGSIFTRFRITDTRHSLGDLELLAPTDPVQIWCPGLNFAEHLEFAGSVLGEEKTPGSQHPEPWQKGRNALNSHEGRIVIPKESWGGVHYEGEAVAVIGRQCRRVAPDQALGHVLGFTCGNDVSERAWQRDDWTFWRAKGSDTFAPVGPWIETDVDPANLEMVVRLNGGEVQRANTRDMLHDFPTVISYISQQVTLYAGDLVFSGTTGSTTAMKPDDVVEVDIQGIGVLRNYVHSEE